MDLNYDLLPTDRLPPAERFLRDPQYAALVDTLYQQILNGNYTPSELREAVVLASTKFEIRHGHSLIRKSFNETPV